MLEASIDAEKSGSRRVDDLAGCFRLASRPVDSSICSSWRARPAIAHRRCRIVFAQPSIG